MLIAMENKYFSELHSRIHQTRLAVNISGLAGQSALPGLLGRPGQMSRLRT